MPYIKTPIEGAEQIVCTRESAPEMMMDIRVRFMAKGETLRLYDEVNETAVLIQSGDAEISWGGETRAMKRSGPFDKKPFCLHFSRGTPVFIAANADSEFIIEKTDNDRVWEPVFYTPETCLYQEFGKEQWGGAGDRIVSTMFDYENAPYSNMVLGEVFNLPGKWSSYPPHHHPQPEVYYYRFDRPQGFGACFIGDDVYKSVERGHAEIPGGKTHQQGAAPGYEMYYVWMVRHVDGDPWIKTRIYAPEHEWLAYS
ncbi:MAG: 5-deoxy-glucuronate isomerase [Clostridiales bacterium]|nr:5-deoxy-glucuronate isomerase [Clostridiales bacterium]